MRSFARSVYLFVILAGTAATVTAQTTDHSLTLVSLPGGTFTMGEPELTYEGPQNSYDALQHQVTLSPFRMSETEVTNKQYKDFLNAALADGLVEVVVAERGPDAGLKLVYGTSAAPVEYRGLVMLNLSGTRVMKDHDNDDKDNNEFTGVIEPENPLNISYIGYDESREAGDWFYVKDPRDTSDFDWAALTDYYNYTDETLEYDTSVLLNDYADWEELADFPNNMPTAEDVRDWPATFIRWYGAKAFALYYEYDLPTEAQWEFAAQGGSGFYYATDDGLVDGDGTSANWNYLGDTPSRGHVLDAKAGAPNPYGLYNLAGSVWEWVDDWYAEDFYADATDPVNTSDASGKKVRRGGSWNYHLSTLKSAARAEDEQFKGNDHFGFRVVAEAEEAQEADLDVDLVAFDASGQYHDLVEILEQSEQAQIQVDVSNFGPSDASGVEVAVVLPSGLAMIANSSAATQGSFDESTGIWSVGDNASGGFPTGEVHTLGFFVTGSAHGRQTVTATVVGNETDPVNTNNDASVEIEVREIQADLWIDSKPLNSLSQAVSSLEIEFGEQANWQIDVANLGPEAASGVTVTNVLPEGLELVAESSSPTHGSFDEQSGIWSIGPLSTDVSDFATLFFSVTATSAGTLESTASVTANETDPDLGNNSAGGSIVVAGPEADLSVTQEAQYPDDRTMALLNSDQVLLLIDVSNGGPDDATGVVVTSVLPEGLQLVPGSSTLLADDTGSFDEDTGIWTIGDLPSGGSGQLGIEVVGTAVGTFESTVTIAGNETDPDADNNTASTSVEVYEVRADLGLSTVFVNAETGDILSTLDFNEQADLLVDVLNSGPDAASGVVVSFDLPAGLVPVADSALPTHGSFDEETGLWTIGDLFPDDPATLSFTVVGKASGAQQGDANVTASETDPNLSDNVASYSVTVSDPADLALLISREPEEILIDTELVQNYHITPSRTTEATIEVEITNESSLDASGILLTGELDTGLLIVPGSATFYSSPQDGYGGSFDEESLIWNAGDLPGDHTVTLTFQVTGSILGTHAFSASVSEDGTDPDPSNNDSNVEVTVIEPEIDLEVDLHFWSATTGEDILALPLGETMVVVVDFYNSSDFIATGVTVSTEIPDGYSIVPGSAGLFPENGVFDETTGILTVSEPVAEGDEYTLTFEVETLAVGELDFAVSGSADETDLVAANNVDTASITINEPAWTVDRTGLDASMRITAAVLFDGINLVEADDKVAAFVDGQVRGVASPATIAGETVFSLEILAATGQTPTLTFTAFDASAGTLQTLTDEILFEAGTIIGNPREPYVLGSVQYEGAPGWTLDSAGYANSMELVGMAFSDGVSFALGDTLAAFVGTDLRGVAPATDESGQIVFSITVHGNPGDGPVSFSLYDSDAEHVNDLTEQINFEPGASYGSISDPLSWNVGALGVPPTWEQEFAAVNTAELSRYSMIAALYIEGFRDTHPENLLVARVLGAIRGVASPTFVDGKALYFLDVYGDPSDVIDFSAYAFDPTDGEQKQFILEEVATFEIGPPVGSPTYPVAMDTRKLTERPSIWNGFDPPTDHTATMVVNGSLSVESMFLGETLLEDLVAEHPDDFVAAFIGDDLRGVAAPEVVNGVSTFPLTVYSDEGDASEITFKAYFAAANVVIDLSEEVTFAENTSVGTPGQIFWQGGSISLDFEVESEGTDSSMNVSGQVVVENTAGKSDDDPTLVPGDQVLAYVGDTLRGTAVLQEGSGGTLVFDIAVAGNDREAVYFKTYSVESNSLFVVDEMVPFSPGGRIGDPANPTRLTASRPVQVDLRIYLEGAFDEGQGRMRTYLAEQDLLPLAQPYGGDEFVGTKLAHPGEETLLTVPPGAVDWVLVDLRTDTSPSSRVATRAGILLSDGRVIHPDGASPVRLLDLPAGDYYIVVRHRNHLPIISASPVALGAEPVRYDFGKAGSQAAGFNAQVSLGSGIFGMFAGDANVSGGISPGDGEAWQSANGTAGYFFEDFDLSGGVTATDYALWLSNLGLRTQVQGF